MSASGATAVAPTSTVAPGANSSTEPFAEAPTAAPNSTSATSGFSAPVAHSEEKKPLMEPATEKATVPAETATEKKDVLIEKAATPIEQLWTLAKSHGHPEIWGVTLQDPSTHVPTQVVLQKYLNAYDGDLVKSMDTLTKTLEWRAKMKPVELLKKHFNRSKFAGLGYTSVYGDVEGTDPEAREVFTWNIYGGVKDLNQTFGDLQEFIEWRVTLMEDALQALGIDKATKPITAESDPYKILQVHDYKSISFLRQSPVVKAASSETIKVFAQNYPELLKHKYFLNVPVAMSVMYTFIKLFVAAKTLKKFHPISNGVNLAREMVTTSSVKGLGEMLPKEYGGKGSDLSVSGRQPALQEGEASAVASKS